MTREALEFQISQYLDGSLSAGERSELEKVLAGDAAARALYEQMRLVDDALKSSMALPPIRWDRVCEAISEAVAGQEKQVREGTMKLGGVDDRLEEAIVMHVQGELLPEQEKRLQGDLEGNAAAREALAQHRALDGLLKHAWPLPHVDFELLQERIAGAVAELPDAEPEPIKLSWYLNHTTQLAMAAAVLIVLSLGVWFAMHRTGPGTIARTEKPIPAEPQGTIEVAVLVDPVQAPARGNGSATAVADVSFGPSPDFSKDRFDRYGSGGVVAIRSRVQLSENTASRVGAYLPY